MTTIRSVDETLLEIRKTIIIAIASDELLMERFVLKGGNAIDLIYRIGERSSLDIDFSMAGDFKDEGEMEFVRDRIFRALRDRFDSLGYILFDEKFEHRPRNFGGPGITVWGGYNACFKLMAKSQFTSLGGMVGVAPDQRLLERIRRQAQIIGPNAERVFTIEISKFEYCTGYAEKSIDGYDCHVYTPAMIAAEKLRAICQQLPSYDLRRHPTPRPRDFFDIHTLYTRAGCDLSHPDHHDIVQNMFAAKSVPLELLPQIGLGENREFHAQQWPAVIDSVRSGNLKSFDFYYDFVVTKSVQLMASLSGKPGGYSRPLG